MARLGEVGEILRETAEVLKPPRRLSVPEAAEQYVMLDIPGGYSGPWSNDLPHYLVEPAACLTMREYQAVIFVGPAQSAKTQMLVDNWTAHTVTCDPADMMIIQTAQDTARDYSKRRIDRLIAASPELRRRLRPGGQSDNTYDKFFRSGMILTLGWPSKNQLAGKAIGKMALTDYDRMPEDLDGEGAPFFLAMKRTTTFLSRGMTMAESSPSKPVLDPKWRPRTPHEAPPSKGILGLYNTGDRRRLYGQCQHCREYFMPAPDPSALWLPESGSIDERAAAAGLTCPHCGAINGPEQERTFKRSGRWLKEGQTIDRDGRIHGEGLFSRRASFWMPGWFAAFQSWSAIAYNYLAALDNHERTGDEEALKNAYNVDMAAPYIPAAQREANSGIDWLSDRAEPLPRYIVPEPARFLTAAVDVQGGRHARFVVQVHAHGPGFEQWLVDRYNITESKRIGPDGQPLPIDPAAYPEDWDLLTEKVLQATYRTSTPGIEWRIKLMTVDTGGEDGVADNAYGWYRRIKREGLQQRVRLIKGASTRNAPRLKETYPDASGRKDRKASSRGDVPLWLLNTEQLKDAVSAGLGRETPGPGYYHFPDWLGSWFYEELSAEIRTAAGWKKLRARNEALDLCVYNRAAALMLGVDKLRWDSPPAWALPGAENSEAVSSGERRQLQAERAPPTRRVVTGRRFG